MLNSPAHMLKGLMLDGGWIVGEKLQKSYNATGGCFSVGYFVAKPTGEQGFLKALDFSGAMSAPDPAREIQALTEAFNYERDILAKCREKRLHRVVYAIDSGKVTVNGFGNFGVVQYLVFERADGDVRRHLDLSQQFDLAWILRTLHHIATGLRQLHGQGVAHQDLKPSNVLVFEKMASKLADLGCSAAQGFPSPRGHLPLPGDRNYAPPDQFYQYTLNDWGRQRYGSDAYLLGSMIVFFFTGVSMTALIARHVLQSQLSNDFVRDLPYFIDAFGLAVQDFENEMVIKLGDQFKEIREVLVKLVRELCFPDPAQRCDPRSRNLGRLMLERYVSRFDLLARRAEVAMFRG